MNPNAVRLGRRINFGRAMGNRVVQFYIAAGLLYFATLLRLIIEYDHTPSFGYILIWMVVYLGLLATERIFTPRLPWYQPVYFFLQTVVVVAMARVFPRFDYYPQLYLALFVQAIWFASTRAAVIWIAVIMAVIAYTEVDLFGSDKGTSQTLVYAAAGFFFSIFGIITLRAERARAQSQLLLAQLQEAHRKLKDYAEQVEELATVQERNRLARELHDSVTQTIFSMTLTAQSALILIDRDPGRVREQLVHLQALSKSALAEMRALIQQLRPHPIAEEGLVRALQEAAQGRREKDGLAVTINLQCQEAMPPALPVAIEETVFRIVQEALNNIVKHAHTDRATVTVDFTSHPMRILIEDQGAGFDPRKMVDAPGHLGLVGMKERAESIGAELTITSKPGAGTRILIELPGEEERIHD